MFRSFVRRLISVRHLSDLKRTDCAGHSQLDMLLNIAAVVAFVTSSLSVLVFVLAVPRRLGPRAKPLKCVSSMSQQLVLATVGKALAPIEVG